MCESLVMNKATSIAMRVFNKQNLDITMQVGGWPDYLCSERTKWYCCF